MFQTKIEPNNETYLQNDIEALLQGELADGWQWVASSSNTKVAYNSNQNIYFKEFLPRNRWEHIKSFFRGSRSCRAMEIADILNNLYFSTPKVILQRYVKGGREYMITEAVNGAGIASYMASFLRDSNNKNSIRWKRFIISSLGKEIGRLHKENIIHGDLRPNNILIELGSNPPKFHFIDNERTRLWPFSPPIKLIKKNLHQIGMLFPIDIKATDRLRFWKAYCSQYSRFSPYNNEANYKLAKDVMHKTLHRLKATPHYSPRKPDLPEDLLKDGHISPKLLIDSTPNRR